MLHLPAVVSLLMLQTQSAAPPTPFEPQFTDAEQQAIVRYWSPQERLVTGLPMDAPVKGPWQVRLTVEGSRWFHAYQRAVGASRIPPSQDAKAATPETEVWENWVTAKLAHDRYKAALEARNKNLAMGIAEKELEPLPAYAAPPGVIPTGLLAATSNPPAFAKAVSPTMTAVTFADGQIYTYPDNVRMRDRFAYYRFSNGSVSYGDRLRDMPEGDLDALFQKAGMNASEARIAKAVSKLEGGFETVNTYDTGFISIGFIQFVTLEKGDHSLCNVMRLQKKDDPSSFERDFRQYGLDVSDDNILHVVDPTTGAELAGAEAVLKVVDDKRLTAPFQRAGRHSDAFRTAQIKIAKSYYWPADDTISVTIGGKQVTGKVSDVLKSEAGMATAYDRKVNRGNISPFADLVQATIDKYQLKSIAEASKYEKEIVAALKYREDFLAAKELSQPSDPPTR